MDFLDRLGIKVWEADGGRWFWMIGEEQSRLSFVSRDAAYAHARLYLLIELARLTDAGTFFRGTPFY